jgi:fibronectin-binding autotransporter adhesin
LFVIGDGALGTMAGGITLSGGTLGTNTFTTSRTVTLVGQGTLAGQGDNNAIATYNGLITGSGGLIVGDANSSGLTVVLAHGTNDYQGGTTVTGGATLEVDGDSELGAVNGAIALNGGTLDTTSVFATSRSVTLAFNLIDNSLFTDSTATYNSPISGPGSLATGGGGTVILTSANSYQGGTKVGFGILSG